MLILGISAYYHDSAAALISDGKIIAAAEEERFSRIKHDNNFPQKAIEFCLRNAGISISEIENIAYYEKPLLKFERILETFIETYPFGVRPFLKAIPEWIDYKIKVEHTIRKKLNYKGKIFFVPHHLSHAAATFYPSPFKSAAVLTIDGVGEYQTTAMWEGKGNKIKHLGSINFPHSLGLLYSTFTAHLGFKVNDDEYKVMGLAAYGKPTFVPIIKKLVDIKDDGSFKLDMKYFSFREDFKMWNRRFEAIFGPSRKPDQIVQARHKNLASSIQAITEEIYFKILNHLYKITRSKNLCLSGGVALNALANGKIYANTPFKNVYIFGPAGDGGNAAGAALFTYHSVLGRVERSIANNLYYGSEHTDENIEETLRHNGLKFKKLTPSEIVIKTARLLTQGKIVGWFQGRFEFGPRALGARSILSAPSPRKMKERVNVIKIREQFRPFAGSVLEEKVHEVFEVPEKNHKSPFMVFCFKVKKERQKDIAAIVHADETCRIQTINKKDNGIYYDLVREFYRLTGIPVILNTSFNLKGEPIVESPQQAIEDFLKTKIDYLAIGNFLVQK